MLLFYFSVRAVCCTYHLSGIQWGGFLSLRWSYTNNINLFFVSNHPEKLEVYLSLNMVFALLCFSSTIVMP